MKKLATLFSDSFKEFKYLENLVVIAMFGALTFVLGQFTIKVTDNLKIGISTVANQMVYYLFGPAAGGIFGGGMDLLKFFVKADGIFNPGITFTAILGGVIYGVFYYKKPLTFRRVLMAQMTVTIICNLFLNTYFLSLINGSAFWAILPSRIVKNIISCGMNSVLFYFLASKLKETGIFRSLKGSKGTERKLRI